VASLYRIVEARFCRRDCVTLRKAHIASITHSWNRVYWKIFKVDDVEFITDIQFFTDHLSIPDDIAKRRSRFIYRAIMYLLTNLI